MKSIFKTFVLAFFAGALVGTLAYVLHPRLANAPAAPAPARVLDFYPPQIRAFLQSGSEGAVALRDASFAADAAVAAAAARLNALPTNAPEGEVAKRVYLEAGVAKLDHIRRVTEAYDRYVTRALAAGDASPDTAVPAPPSLSDVPAEVSANITAAISSRSASNVAFIAAFSVFALVLLIRFVAALVPAKPAPVADGTPFSVTTAVPPPPRPAPPLPPGSPDLTTRRRFQLALGQPRVPLVMLPVTAGSFVVGEGERAHTVSIGFPFWLGEKEVTQAQWNALMDENPSSHQGDLLPVESVSHDKVAEFCKKITTAEAAARRLPEGYAYALPLESEWEYAARAGGGATNSGGTAADNAGQTRPVGQGLPNAWGFFDMRGNVSEMCADRAVGNMVGGNREALQHLGDNRLIIRGASFAQPKQGEEVRDAIIENTVDERVGFRLALRRIP